MTVVMRCWPRRIGFAKADSFRNRLAQEQARHHYMGHQAGPLKGVLVLIAIVVACVLGMAPNCHTAATSGNHVNCRPVAAGH